MNKDDPLNDKKLRGIAFEYAFRKKAEENAKLKKEIGELKMRLHSVEHAFAWYIKMRDELAEQ